MRKPPVPSGSYRAGGIALALLFWALVGALVGLAVSLLIPGMIQAWRGFMAFGVVLGSAIGLHPKLRGKLGVGGAAFTGAVLGGALIFVAGGAWQVAAYGILIGAFAGGVVGDRLQQRFTRNLRRDNAGGFYSGR